MTLLSRMIFDAMIDAKTTISKTIIIEVDDIFNVDKLKI